MDFAVLGAGAWGSAMAIHLHRAAGRVMLVPRRPDHAREIITRGENKPYLPGVAIPSSIEVTVDLAYVLGNADVILLACPSHGLRAICESIRAGLGPRHRVRLLITLCKGLEENTNFKPTEVIAEVLPDIACGTLSGPTFASEVAVAKPTAMVFASHMEEQFIFEVQRAVSNPSLRVYTSNDLDGVELGACLKNVYAISAGICDGLTLGESAKATLLTRALAEMVRLGIGLGGRRETFYGLSGCGDLLLTCNGAQSRNRTFGELVGQGKNPQTILAERKMTVEGYRTTQCFQHLCCDLRLDAPILNEIHDVLYRQKEPRLSIQSLMGRELKAESRG